MNRRCTTPERAGQHRPGRSINPMTARADRYDLALDKARAERSLHEFFRQSWHITTPGSVLCDGWHLEAMAAHLEAVLTA